MGVVSSMLTWARNNHIRKSGFTPYQFLLGKSPRIPTSLTAVLEDGRLNLSAHTLSTGIASRAPRHSANELSTPWDGRDRQWS